MINLFIHSTVSAPSEGETAQLTPLVKNQKDLQVSLMLITVDDAFNASMNRK